MIKKGAFDKMKSGGYIAIHRKILNNPVVCKDNDYFRVWLQLLLSASHEEYAVMFGGKKIVLKPGQLITGRAALGKDCIISQSKVERILTEFESDGQIKQQANSHGRLITILKWADYQKSGQQTDSKRTTSEQQMDTNNKVDKVNKVNKVKKVNKTNKKASAPAEPPPFTGAMLNKVNEWLQFKKERKSTYTPTGQRALYKRIQDNIDRLGEEVVISCIDKSISNNWQGLFFPDSKPKTANSDDDFFVKVARGEIEI